MFVLPLELERKKTDEREGDYNAVTNNSFLQRLLCV